MRSLNVYLLTRILTALLSLFLLLSLVFVALRVLPGDPAEMMLPESAPRFLVERLRHEMGLDKPIYLQFADYLANLLHGDMGKSLWTQRSVAEEIAGRFPVSLELTTLAMILSLALGIPAGVYSASRRNRPIDHILRVGSVFLFSFPVFFVAVVLQLVFGVYLGWFPVYGRNTAGVVVTSITGLNTVDSILTLNFAGLLDSLRCLTLPVISLSCFLTPVLLRMSRASMISVLGEAYVVLARAKGLPGRVVVYKHALRNALLPIMTTGAMYYVLVLGGAVMTETIFSLPGIGRLLVDAALRRDFPLVQGCVIFYCLLVIVVSIAIDVISGFLDPRIRVAGIH
jgi:peptide/nickel transport system permease protein